MNWQRWLLPAIVTLCVDQVGVHHLHSPIPDIVHPLHPQYSILCLELFCYALPAATCFTSSKNMFYACSFKSTRYSILVQLANDL